MLESFFNKNAGLQLYYKQTPTQLFSCEFSEFFEDRFFYKTSPVAAFDQQ